MTGDSIVLHPGFESDRAAEGTDGSPEGHGGDAVVYARRYEPVFFRVWIKKTNESNDKNISFSWSAVLNRGNTVILYTAPPGYFKAFTLEPNPDVVMTRNALNRR